jgi:hypothetical protein
MRNHRVSLALNRGARASVCLFGPALNQIQISEKKGTGRKGVLQGEPPVTTTGHHHVSPFDGGD